MCASRSGQASSSRAAMCIWSTSCESIRQSAVALQPCHMQGAVPVYRAHSLQDRVPVLRSSKHMQHTCQASCWLYGLVYSKRLHVVSVNPSVLMSPACQQLWSSLWVQAGHTCKFKGVNAVQQLDTIHNLSTWWQVLQQSHLPASY